MRLSSTLVFALASAQTITGLLIPEEVKALSVPDWDKAPADFLTDRSLDSTNALEKRKGGGGRGGGGGSSSSGSSSGSSGGARSGSGSSGSGSSSSGGRTGPSPSYGGGRYYGGGAAVPYSAGRPSPRGGITPILLPLAALSIFPGLWLYSVYAYPYSHPYTFYNQSANQNQTKPVQCLCQQYSDCGCDENDDSDYMTSIIGNGSYAGLNKTLATVSDVNGTSTIVINGTLPNGTTASGGSDSTGTTSAGVSLKQGVLEHAGWWIMGAIVVYGTWFL